MRHPMHKPFILFMPTKPTNALQQGTFDLPLPSATTFEQFHTETHPILCDVLHACSTGTLYEPFIYLWGAHGTGRTHLLKACCHTAQQHGYFAHYAASTLPSFQPKNSRQLICIDDIETLLGTHTKEIALLQHYQSIIAQNDTLICTASCSPRQLICALPDLKSRLNSGLTFHLQPLNDTQKREALQKRATLYGLTLSKRAADFLLTHYSRNPHDLFKQIEQLHQGSLIEKRPITLPLIKQYTPLEEDR